jgi:hypothetical protein
MSSQKSHVSRNSGRVEPDQATSTEPSTTPAVVDAAAPKPHSKSKSVEKLRADYEELVTQVQTAAKATRTLEGTLLAEVKAKLTAHAGDIDALKAKKREAFTAWETAARDEGHPVEETQ